MNESKILLIGYKGYIGSRLFAKLQKENLVVSGLDISDEISFQEYGYDYSKISLAHFSTIILLAGHASMPMCQSDSLFSFENNVTYFYNLCSKLNENQLLIYASSASVYGFSNNESTERSVLKTPLVRYDLQKQLIDNIAKFFISKKKQIVGLRFGTVCGFSENFRTDVVINSMVFDSIRNNTLTVKNPLTFRSILGLSDLCDAIYKIITNKKIYLGQYNLSSFNASIDEIAIKISNRLNSKILYLKDDEIIFSSRMSSHKFEKKFGFTFNDNIETIINDIVLNYNKINLFNRRDIF